MKKVKALLLAGLVMIGIAGTACAEHYGPIRSSLAAGEVGTGVGFAYDAMEWEGKKVRTGLVLDARQSVLTAQLGFGLGRGWETVARIGAAGLTIDNGRLTSNKEFAGGFQPLYSASLGGPIYNGRILTIGPFVQGSYVDLYSDQGPGVANSVAGTEKVSIEGLWTVSTGLTFQLDLEGATLYFGPVYTAGGGEYRAAFTPAAGGATIGEEGTIEPERSVAAFSGIRWPLPTVDWPFKGSRTYLDLEARFKNNLSGGGALSFTY